MNSSVSSCWWQGEDIMSEFVFSECMEEFPRECLGKLIFNSLKTLKDDVVLMLDYDTKDTLTVKKTLDRSIRLAINLSKVGVGLKDVVGIVSQNSLDYVTICVSSIFLGAAVHPLNPSYTKREIKNAFDISKPKVVFVEESCFSTVAPLKDEVDYVEKIFVMGSGDLEGSECSEEEVLGFRPVDVDVEEHVSAILCSSGTTGLPKAVMLTNLSIVGTIDCLRDERYFLINEETSTIGILPFYHIFGLLITLSSLTIGFKQVLLQKFKPDTFLEIIQEHKINLLFIVPPMALFLAKSPLVEKYDITSIQDLMCGAAPLGEETQNLLEKRLNLKVRQLYGLSETGILLAIPINKPNKIGSVGKLTKNITIKVVDIDTRLPVGPNCKGEICTKSKRNMKGYLGNEEATKEAFDDEGFLRTGDIGYYDEDGYFYIVDRLKELIKFKGFQVPPAELEDLLMLHESIKDAAVVGLPDEKAGELPVAFVVKQPGKDVMEKEVIDFVAGQVSYQKQLHGGVRFVDEIPKSATGKILRKELRKLLC